MRSRIDEGIDRHCTSRAGVRKNADRGGQKCRLISHVMFRSFRNRVQPSGADNRPTTIMQPGKKFRPSGAEKIPCSNVATLSTRKRQHGRCCLDMAARPPTDRVELARPGRSTGPRGVQVVPLVSSIASSHCRAPSPAT